MQVMTPFNSSILLYLSVYPELVEEVELLVDKVNWWGQEESQWQVHKLERSVRTFSGLLR